MADTGERVAEGWQRFPVPARSPHRQLLVGVQFVGPECDQGEQAKQDRRGAVYGHVRPLPLGLDAEVAADLGECDLDRPTTNEPAEDVERLRSEIGAEECLGLALTRRVTDQDVADGNAVAGLGPESGAGDDLARLLATAIPSAHPQAAPSRPRVVEALLERGLAGPDQARPPALARTARRGRIAERRVEPQAGDHGDPVPYGLKQFDN